MANNILAGKKGIIFGALDEQSIAWHIAEACYAEGARFTLTNAPVALRFGKINELAEKTESKVIAADATSLEDLENLVDESKEFLGGNFDFVLHSIGMSINVRKKREYTNLKYDWLQKTLDISAISFHKVMQTLYQKDAMNEWGSIMALSYIAAQKTFPEYNEMAEAKALLESYARSFGYHYGMKKNVRVNTISQSPTMTTAGSGVKGFGDFFSYAAAMSPLGNADAASCAAFCATMFSDYTKMITMQNLYHDGGFSSMGINSAMLQTQDSEA